MEKREYLPNKAGGCGDLPMRRSPRTTPMKDPVLIAQVDFLHEGEHTLGFNDDVNGCLTVSGAFALKTDEAIDSAVRIYNTPVGQFQAITPSAPTDVFTTPKKVLRRHK